MMNAFNWLAVALCGAVFVTTFALGDHPALFINGLGLAIVLSGTLGALFLSYPMADISAAFRVAHNSLTVQPPTAETVVNTLLDLAVRSRRKGVLVLEDAEEETTVSFLKRALGLVVDGYRAEEIRDILQTEMHYFSQRRAHQERVFHHLARLAPAFGVAGSVVGLIAMLAGIGDPDVILRTIPVALTSTLYGILLGNFLLTPLAENINAKTRKELLMQRLVSDGVLAIRQEHNPFRLAKKLESFLTPAARGEKEQSLEEIRERFRQLQAEESA